MKSFLDFFFVCFEAKNYIKYYFCKDSNCQFKNGEVYKVDFLNKFCKSEFIFDFHLTFIRLSSDFIFIWLFFYFRTLLDWHKNICRQMMCQYVKMLLRSWIDISLRERSKALLQYMISFFSDKKSIIYNIWSFKYRSQTVQRLTSNGN